MDNYVKNKLKEWKLERFIGIFRENKVSRRNFHLLTEDAVAGLIPSVQPRMTFLKKFEQLNEVEKTKSDVAEDFISSPSHDSQLEISDVADNLCKNSSDLHKMNVKTLLSKNHAGRQILTTLKSGKPPTNFLRKKLAVFLFDDLIQSYGPNPAAHLKMEMAKAIVKEFPHIYIQKKDIAYEESTPIQQQKESSKNNKGSKKVFKRKNLNKSCDFCSKISSVYLFCNGLCKKKFCSDCCSVADIKRLSKAAKTTWKCKDCRKVKQSSTLDCTQQEDSLSSKNNHQEVFHPSTSIPVTVNTMQSDCSQALESSAPARKDSCINDENNDHHYHSSSYSEVTDDVSSENQDENRQSGSLALVCCEEPIIKKELNMSYESDENSLIIDLLPAIEETPIDSIFTNDAMAVVPLENEGSMDMTSAANNSEEDLNKFDVRAILEKTNDGKDVLKSLDCHDVTITTRRLIVRLLIQELVNRFGLYPSSSTTKGLALAICDQFPYLSTTFGGYEAWFSRRKGSYAGFLYQKLLCLRKKHHTKKKVKNILKKASMGKSKSGSKPDSKSKVVNKPEKIQFTDSEVQKAQEEVLDQLNDIWDDMSTNYCQTNTNVWQSSPKRTTDGTDIENTDSTINHDDCVAVANDEQFNSIDETDGLTVVAYDDYCALKCQNDILEQENKKERELRQSAEEKLAKVEAEKLALEQEVFDYRSRRIYTRWKHSTVEYCRRKFQWQDLST